MTETNTGIYDAVIALKSIIMYPQTIFAQNVFSGVAAMAVIGLIVAGIFIGIGFT